MPSSRSLVRMIAQALLVLLSLVLALGITEAGLRVLKPQIFPTIPAGLFTTRSDGFKVLTPGFGGVISRAEFHTPVRISEFGVRGDGPLPRGPKTFRILSLGDSQTFGFGVLDDEIYSVRLEKILSDQYPDRDIQVVNAGVPGYGTVDQLLWLRSRGAEVDPDLIMVQFLSVNDFFINRGSPHTPVVLGEAPVANSGTRDAAMVVGIALPTGTLDSSSVRTTAIAVTGEPHSLSARFVRSVHALKRRSHAVTLISEAGSYLGMRVGLLGGFAAMWGEDFSVDDARRTKRLMVLVAEEARRLRTPMVILYTTGKAQIIAGNGAGLPSADVIREAALEAAVPWINMADELRARADRQDLYFVRDGHWTAAGHQAVAEVLAQRLPELGLLPVR